MSPETTGASGETAAGLAELRRLVMRFAATWADRVAEWRATVEERRAVHERLADDLDLLESQVGLDLRVRWGWPEPADGPR